MLIKAAGDRERNVRVLSELLDHPAASKDVRGRIQDEMRKIQGGAKGEAEAAYELDFHFGQSPNWAVIHRTMLESEVLVTKGATIARPRRKIDGLERAIKNDQLRAHIDRAIDGNSAAGAFVSVAKLVSSQTVEQFARQLVALHRPIQFDWHARFGLATRPAEAAHAATPVPMPRAPVHASSRQASPQPPSPAEVPLPTATPEPSGDDDVHQGPLSTSKFAAARGWKTAEALKRLIGAGSVMDRCRCRWKPYLSTSMRIWQHVAAGRYLCLRPTTR